MPRLLPRSLRARVTVVGVVTLALVLGLGAWVTVRALGAALRADTQAQNDEVIDELEASIDAGVPPEALLLPVATDGTEFLILDESGFVRNASFFAAPGADAFGFSIAEVFPPDQGGIAVGNEVFEFEAASQAELEAILATLAAEAPPNAIVDEGTFVDAGNWFESRRTIVTPAGDELTVLALTPFGIVGRSVTRLSIALAIIVPLLVLAGGAAIWVAIGAALQPVQRISDEAARIAPSNARGRLPVPESGDEIAELTVTLNDMLDRLDAGLVRQRAFVSDASHELRSPLTAVKGAAELLDMRDDLPADTEPTVHALTRGTERLEAVLDDLTQLADGGTTPMIESVDLDVILHDEIDELRRSAPDHVTIQAALTPIVIQANATQIRRAVTNLVSNAMRHAESTVEITSSATDRELRITVDDDGPGVAEADRERIFERFVRVDDARTRAAGGSGLGLALVASIVADHGGTAWCETSPSLGGARFAIELPVSSPDDR